MKKVLVFILIMSGLASVAQAQYKPEKGNFTTELQFSLFNINAKFDDYGDVTDFSTGPFTMPGLRFRYFTSEKWAIRATLGFNVDHDKVVQKSDDSWESYYWKEVMTREYTAKNRYTTFSIAPGLEYHFGNWERMSLYAGGELFFGITTSKSTVEMEQTKTFFDSDYDGSDWSHKIKTEASAETKNCRSCYGWGCDGFVQDAPMSFGLNALFGMDFYIYKGLYMGAEFGLGYTYQTYLKGSYKEDYKITTMIKGTDPDIIKDSYEETLDDKITSGNFSVRYNPMIRLGWRF